MAEAVGIAHEVITTDELARPGYRANDTDRCYHCKSELYDSLAALSPGRQSPSSSAFAPEASAA